MFSCRFCQIVLYSPTYFAVCGVGGILSCGLTHTLMTPLDLVKCNAQANPLVFGKGAIAGTRAIYSGHSRSSRNGIRTGTQGTREGLGTHVRRLQSARIMQIRFL